MIHFPTEKPLFVTHAEEVAKREKEATMSLLGGNSVRG